MRAGRRSALVACATVCIGACSCDPGIEPPALNVVLITLDTTRADRLGCYGYDRPTSTHLDQLASEAVVFDLAIAQAAVTPVSHASILTGLEPYHHRLRVMHGLVENRLAEERVTLAERWLEAGGRTAAFISAFPVGPHFGLDQGFQHFDADFPRADGAGLVTDDGKVNTGLSQRRADGTTDAALAWLEREYERERPLFMWVHYFDPHDSFVTPPRATMERLMNGELAPPTWDRPDVVRAQYDCDVHYMDEQIGRLLAALRARGLWGNTIVVVVGDHGEGLGDHDWWTHGILYQEQIRVPCLIRAPGVAGGRRIGSLVRTIDLMPTILELAGLAPDRWPAMDGASLVGTLRSGAEPAARRAYSESVNILQYARNDMDEGFERKDDKLYCLMDARYKLIYHQLHPEASEFYDLAADPDELRDLAGGERPPAMLDLLRELESMGVFSKIMPGMTATDLDRLRQLESLGYVR